MLHLCESFDNYTSTADLIQRKWNASLFDIGDWEWIANEGVNGGGCLKHISSNIGDRIGVKIDTVFSSRAEFRTLFWFKIATPPTEQLKLFQWAAGFWLAINSNGTFEIQGIIGGSFGDPDKFPIHYASPFAVCDNEWHCLEVAADTLSDKTLRVGLDDFILFDGAIDTTSTSSLFLYFYSIGVNTWIDDLIIWDERGDNPVEMPWGDFTDTRADEFIWDWYNTQPVNGDLNNFPERGQDDFFYWIGAQQITTLRPSSDGTINDFDVVGAGTKLDAIDDVVPTDGKYLTENQPGARALFNFEDFPYDLPVYSVVVNSRHVMADFGSIVGHAEALVTPDFSVGVRRRISGDYKFMVDTLQPNIVLNSGGPFITTDNWNIVSGILEVDVDGQLKLSYPDGGSGLVTTPIAVTPGKGYYIRLTRGDAPTFYDIFLRVCRNADGTELIDLEPSWSADTQQISANGTRVIRFVAPDDLDTVYIRISPSSSVNGRYGTWYSVFAYPELHKWDFRQYQWAFRYNPATDLEWDQASINAAEFGMRIAP